MAIINLTGNFTEFNTQTRTCGTETFSARANTVIELVTPEGSDKWVIKARRAYVGDDQIQKAGGQTYCISTADLESFFIDFSKIDYGILSVPFKVRFEPFKVFPGGTLGGFIGRKFVTQRSTSSWIGFAGLSSIPLNNINSDVIDTKLGVIFGTGYVWYVTDDFQLGAVMGWDIFDGVGDWVYKYQPWVSFNVGYTFTSNQREREERVANLPVN